MAAHQAPPSLGFSRQEHWSGLPFPSPGDLPDPGIKLTSSASPALAGRFFTTEPEGKSQWKCLLISIFSGTQVTKFVVFKFPRWLVVITKLSAETGGIDYNVEMGRGLHFGGWKYLYRTCFHVTGTGLLWKFRCLEQSLTTTKGCTVLIDVPFGRTVGLYTALESDHPPGRPWEVMMRDAKKWKLFSCLTYIGKTSRKTLFLAVKTKQKAAFSCQPWDVFIL